MNVILSLLCVGRIDIFGRKSVVLLKSNPQSPELGCSGSSTIELSLHKSGLEIGIGGSYYPLQLWSLIIFCSMPSKLILHRKILQRFTIKSFNGVRGVFLILGGKYLERTI